ncbi:SpaA isopeptide-forming pilin-related protein [Bifidobacterium margollesii]|uniref:SpaA isopeptide-forming pilin-related protein n=1 Tax=Bifidobacterium margollesii TaxID=2020964 RepID=UPI0013FD44E1|nr:SpaA isopeptide-forming pilin-related protein [Bifidobacterium margollesii]
MVNNIKAIKAAVASIAVAAMLLIGLPVAGVANAADAADAANSSDGANAVTINPSSDPKSGATPSLSASTGSSDSADSADTSNDSAEAGNASNTGNASGTSNTSGASETANTAKTPTSDSPTGSAADDSAGTGDAPAAAPAAANCQAVTTWADLKSCIEDAAKDANVSIVITKPIVAAAGGSITIDNKTVAITSTVDPATGSALASAAGDPSTAGALFTVRNGGSLALGQENDAAGTSFSYAGTEAAPLTRRLVKLESGAKLTINGGKFSNNKTDEGGVIYNNAGTVTINGGTFKNNTAVNGGVLFQTGDAAKLSITGGTFTGNKSVDSGNSAGGGVLFQNGGKTTITGGTFTGNAQTYTAECTNDKPDACRHMRSGGGAIHAERGTLTIVGNVTFAGNYSKAYGWGDGGGALYVQGTLWIYNDSRGNKPTFKGNWSGIYDTQYVKDANGNEQVPNGGAGGAIFLQDSQSTAYLMGGSFTGNSSGYLGGAIYTEDKSTTYVAKAVAYENMAGHFGGGLWLCPSGSAESSKGGNIALFDNEVNRTIDPNKENQTAANVNDADGNKADGTEAGADFAIMNPYHKKHDDTSFMLMDTWFTDRTDSAVTWYYDGIPVQNASGYDDSYQNPQKQDWAGVGGVGTNLAVTKSDGRYKEGQNNAKIEDGEYENNHTKNLTLGWNGMADGKQETFHDRGIALKSVVKGDAEEQQARKNAAKNSAAVEITGNKARLSGGAFGTNGNVKFSTPYTASWSKVDGTNTSKRLVGAEWTVSSTGSATADTEEEARRAAEDQAGGPFEEDFYPTLCATDVNGELTDAGKAAYADGTCWKQTIAVANNNGTYTVKIDRAAIVKDNTGLAAYVGFDNNPDDGGFDINNLHNGTYTVRERKAPAGYMLSADTYTFTVKDAQAQWDNGNQAGTIDKDIPNTAAPGVSWRKLDADTGRRVSGTSWTVVKIDSSGKEIGDRHTVDDCVDPDTDTVTKAVPCSDGKNDDANKTYADINGNLGGLRIIVGEAGTYKLTETVPDGYWKPVDDGSYYFFIVPPDANANTSIDVQRHDGTSGKDTVVENKEIDNTQPQASWSKVAKDNADELLDGSEWQVRGPLNENGTEIAGLTVTAPVTDCESKSGATDPCESHVNTTNDHGVITKYEDVDSTAGQFKILGLARPTTNGQKYRYELTETKAPDGYVLAKTTYTFEILDSVNTHVLIDAPNGSSLPVTHTGNANLIPNVRAVASLPLTGGTTAREWLLIGGGIAFAAAAAGFGVNEYRKRRSVMV